MSVVRTRFAPSPTGYMHIGGMRTALFNWLWARHNGGQFILRIDDTDQERNNDEALGPILAAFRWLGLDWDEGPEVGGEFAPYFQSQRTEFYRAACETLLKSGKAYRDFDPPEAIKADREQADKDKQQYMNVRRSLDLSEAEVEQLIAENQPYVIRLLVDRTAKVSITDQVRGDVEWDCSLINDPVIMRADGSPLYNFATVVDDAHLKITHVIRAEEHLSNTPTQLMLFDALEYERPVFAHIPFVAGPDGKKISKREKYVEKLRKDAKFGKLFQIADDVLPQIGMGSSETINPVMVAYYEAVGFMPEAILNGLSRLGWSFDDKTEQMSLEFVTKEFTLDRVVKASAALDPDKLLSFQEYWISTLSLEEKIDRCVPYLVKSGMISEEVTDQERSYIGKLLTALSERIKLFSDVLSYDEFFVPDEDLEYDEKAFQKRLVKPENAAPLLAQFRDVLATTEAFDAASLEDVLKSWVEEAGINIGDIIHALRMSVTGKPAGPGMFETLELLGKERCLVRIGRTLEILNNNSSPA